MWLLKVKWKRLGWHFEPREGRGRRSKRETLSLFHFNGKMWWSLPLNVTLKMGIFWYHHYKFWFTNPTPRRKRWRGQEDAQEIEECLHFESRWKLATITFLYKVTAPFSCQSRFKWGVIIALPKSLIIRPFFERFNFLRGVQLSNPLAKIKRRDFPW